MDVQTRNMHDFEAKTDLINGLIMFGEQNNWIYR